MNELTKKKIASKLKGRKKAARTKWLISQSMRGKVKTEQHKQAISESMRLYWDNLLKNKVDGR
ncbi:hypothetical protein [Bacteroides clarus]|jgi:hypothetical protein|uniref:hypothetical protein n=1 Tax=Bacteroides clarus TaxID=626929 RepID=UPI00266C68D8|nr:hypothetical protein [Bacteroides clarus]